MTKNSVLKWLSISTIIILGQPPGIIQSKSAWGGKNCYYDYIFVKLSSLSSNFALTAKWLYPNESFRPNVPMS